MTEPTWITYLTTFGSVATPILVAVLGGIGWKLRTQVERRLELEKKLRDDRIEIYNDILEPFITLLMSDAAWKADPRNKNKDKNELAIRAALSLDYRRQAFRLALLGSDGVVKAYNDLMQSFFQEEAADASNVPVEKVKHMLALIGHLLLEIRRSMGNEATELDKWSMIEWFITDARKYRD